MVGVTTFPVTTSKLAFPGLGAMPNILKLSTFNFTWSHRQTGTGTFEGLNARHFINADGAFSLLSSLRRTQIMLANVFHPGFKLRVVRGEKASNETGAV
jgi:hypothetical protein